MRKAILKKRRPSFRPILFNCVTPASQLDPAFCKRLKTKTCGSRTCKPNSVCRCRQDGHSSGPRITAGLKRPTRRLWRAEPARVPGEPEGCREIPPYLVLLRVGFALPAALLRQRCALTAPFHPYLSLAARAGCFLWHFPSNDPAPTSAGALPDVIRHTALRSSDFPPVLRRATVRSGCQQIHYSAGRECGPERQPFSYSCALGASKSG